jgi:hypothetical protein
VAEAAAEAERLAADAAAEAERLAAEAAETVTEAERVMQEARAEAEARLLKVREMERLAHEQADRLRKEAARDADTARQQARDEVLRILAGAREDRRRGEERRASLQAQLAVLEQRLAEVTAGAQPVAVPAPREAPPVDVVPRSSRRVVRMPHLGRRHRPA